MNYRDLVNQVRNDPSNIEKIELLKLRELFICCASMLYNKDYIDVINMLTGVTIRRDDIVTLSDKLKREFKIKEKRLSRGEQEQDVFSSVLKYTSP